MPTAYLSLGSNVGDRENHLRAAIAHLTRIGPVSGTSSYYETEPVEFTEQPWFLNCAVALSTSAKPQELLQEVLAIEREMGRDRALERRKGPRVIDIDILLIGDLVLDSPGLTVPHPAMHQRRFVLEPLAEIAPLAQHPILKRSVQDLLADLPKGQEVRRILGPGNLSRCNGERPA